MIVHCSCAAESVQMPQHRAPYLRLQGNCEPFPEVVTQLCKLDDSTEGMHMLGACLQLSLLAILACSPS